VKNLSHRAFRHPIFLRRSRAEVCAVAVLATILLAAPYLRSQAKSEQGAAPVGSTGKIAAVTSLRIVQEKDGPAVEILSTKPLVPSIKAFGDPPRLVIDLPNARLETQKRISVQADQIDALRANQFQQNPPVVRVVVDLQAPRAYQSEAAGNRLVIHLGKNPNQASSKPSEAPVVAPSVPSLTSAPPPVVVGIRAPGPLTLAASTNGSGSSITAGAETTVVNLSSGGEVHVCPGTTISLTPSTNRHNIMLSMNTGALETHLLLDASSDSVITPDFRIVLTGPGEFDFAISADSQGNTCMRALTGNTASAVVSELIGDRSYQVKATDQLVFRQGQLDRVDMAVPLECGCPPPRNPSLRATNNPPMQSEVQIPPLNKALPATNTNAPSPVETAPLEASPSPNDLQVQVEAPFVFHATGPPPAPLEDVRALPLGSRSQAMLPALAALVPPSTTENPRATRSETPSANSTPAPGFFRKVGRFFASLFH
jgi:hypothetical protein